MRRGVLTALILITAGCATGGTGGVLVPPGSRLILNEPLTIPGRESFVPFQDGKTRFSSFVDPYYPNCRLVLKKKTRIPLTLNPGAFEITDTRFGDSEMVGSDTYRYFTSMSLHADKQPQVAKMICQKWNNTGDDTDVTVEDIRATLGRWFTLQLP